MRAAGSTNAFANPTESHAKVRFQSCVPRGHENCFDELFAILREGAGKLDPHRIAELSSATTSNS